MCGVTGFSLLKSLNNEWESMRSGYMCLKYIHSIKISAGKVMWTVCFSKLNGLPSSFNHVNDFPFKEKGLRTFWCKNWIPAISAQSFNMFTTRQSLLYIDKYRVIHLNWNKHSSSYLFQKARHELGKVSKYLDSDIRYMQIFYWSFEVFFFLKNSLN